MRDYRQANYDYMNQMGSAGGQRLGRGLAGLGNIKAGAERQRQALLQDWMGQQRQGFQDLWYDPQKSIWNQARTQGQQGEMPSIPTWDEYYDKYGSAYGAGESTSPLYS
jgi:hypothetical protein